MHLHQAIEEPNPIERKRKVVQLIENGADVHQRNILYETSLLSLVKDQSGENCMSDKDFIEIAKMLIDKGAEIDAIDKRGFTSLHNASYSNNSMAVQLLIENGANVNKKSRSRLYTSLHLACIKGCKSVVEILLQNGVCSVINDKTQSGHTALDYAHNKGFLEIIHFLIDHGGKSEIYANQLLTAVRVNDLHKVKYLIIRKGANLETKHDVSRSTPLIIASKHGFKDIVEILLMHGANVHAKDSIGYSALSYAIQKNDQGIAKSLIKYKASVNEPKMSLLNPLLLALYHCHFDIAKLLIENGADINAQQIMGNSTFLICAIYDVQKEKVLWLIKNGASLKKNYGQTPFQFALINKKVDFFKMISYHQGK